MYAHLARTWVRKLGPTLVLITCHDPNAPTKTLRYWGSTLLDLTAQQMVDILAIRWEIETFFEYEKDLLGSDHYQVMSAQGVLRFWTLIACLMCFLEAYRSESNDAPTCGDVRQIIQAEHQRNLLHWLKQCFENGDSVDLVWSKLALSDS